ncbi:hypothetical protein AJ80_07641 [Polytolypa hystricis UAMH7299]|uniref:Uncharacterized protein n=1 Tax=Polytolypa hystricis (strain UAMH7299) TaxID=1447883 RepID=A0A2B7XL76_POLH7|nr:hypothetical protein AJ80_07641 [Polytolypa hystricis UAMH7299]
MSSTAATEVHSCYAAPTAHHASSHSPQLVDQFFSQYSSLSSASTAVSPSLSQFSKPSSYLIQMEPRRNLLQRAIDRVHLAYYRYEVTFGVYVMTPPEKLIANTFLIVCVSLLMWALFLYFPSVLFYKIGRLVWLITGNNRCAWSDFAAHILASSGGSGSSPLTGPPDVSPLQ